MSLLLVLEGHGDTGPISGQALGMTNIVARGGENLDIARDIVEHRLDDLLAFVTAIRGRLQ
jgi:hypothetical protein